jgi:predicted TIM-barrel fold metal-dependent hydrolase
VRRRRSTERGSAMTIATRDAHSPTGSYAAGRLIHDADAHMVEYDGFFEAYADEAVRDRLAELDNGSRGRRLDGAIDAFLAAHHSAGRTGAPAADVLLHKNLDALGSFDAEDRVQALDLLGFQRQLIFTSSFLNLMTTLDRNGPQDLSLGATRAHNRGMIDFCSVDSRLLPVCWVPMASIEDALEIARVALDAGAAALMIPSICPREHGPTHIGFDPLWAMAEEAGIPIVFHVGGGRAMDSVYKNNGLPDVKDFHGGDGNFTSVSFMAIAEAPMQTLATMIFDGVLDRFPTLRIGVIEQGALWLPGWMRSMDSAAGAFIRNEERLQRLSLTPSEFVQRQVRVTPYPHEDVGWIIRNSGEGVCMFSSDYPHIEGGRNPLKRFDASLEGLGEGAKTAFFASNFCDLMGDRAGVS